MLEHQRKTSRNIGKQENYNAQFVKFLLIQDHNIVAKKMYLILLNATML